MGTISENLMCYEPDTAYGLHPIRRISDESALAVEIDFTWSLGFGSVEPDRPPIPLSSRISLIMFEFSSCLFADSAINLVSDSSNVGLRLGNFHCYVGRILALLLCTVSEVDRVLQTICNNPLQDSFSGNGTFRVKNLPGSEKAFVQFLLKIVNLLHFLCSTS
ncbi:hypothetical protein Tco_1478164, partial [Tanacetum coccineum]